MALGVAFPRQKSRLKEVRSRNKSAHQIIVGYVGAVYTSILLGNHPVPPKDNYGQNGQHKLVLCLHARFTGQWRFQSLLFVYANYNSKCRG